MTGPRPRIAVAAPWVLLSQLMFIGAVAAQPMPPGSRLDGFWDAWLERAGPLLSEEERLYFQILEEDRARELFVEALWRSRGPDALERWRRNLEDARRLRSRSPGRERAVVLVGKPGSIEMFQRCGSLRRLEVWSWEPWQLAFQGAQVAEAQYLVFVESTTLALGSFEPWAPGDVAGLTRGLTSYGSVDELISGLDTGACLDGAGLGRLRRALEQARSFDDLRAATGWPQPPADWLHDLPQRTDFAAALEIDFPGAFTRYTILRGRLEVPLDRLAQLAPGQIFDRVTIVGDVFHGSRLVDSFEIAHHIAGTAPGKSVELAFYRRLPPGRYRLRLRAADRYQLALLREDREIEVPEPASDAPEPAGHAEGFSRLTRTDLVQLNTFPSVEILPPTMDARGRSVAKAITNGGPIAAVEFRLDGAPGEIDDRPPFLYRLPEIDSEATLVAIALDPSRRHLAEDRRTLTPPNRPFQVRFGGRLSDPARVAVQVTLPEGALVESFECRYARRTLHQATGPPFECPLPNRPASAAEYLSARVRLVGGEEQDDVLFLGPGAPERVDVQLGELYLTVLDGAGRPASGIRQDDLRVWEAGDARPVVRVEPLVNLPLNIAVLMDISSSMGRRLETAADSAHDFFERVLREGDLASLLAFNHDLHTLVPFTGDSEALRFGAVGLRAWGATRLHDAIIHALFQFTGRSSRRALIVLSDGSDVGSDFPIEQVVDLAVQAGVTVYTISLGRVLGAPVEDSGRLANATGGRAFSVASPKDLPAVYRRIEQELRAQYLLVYEPAARDDLTLPQIEVEVMREGHRAREVRRYQP